MEMPANCPRLISRVSLRRFPVLSIPADIRRRKIRCKIKSDIQKNLSAKNLIYLYQGTIDFAKILYKIKVYKIEIEYRCLCSKTGNRELKA